jgi:ribosome-associated protein
LLVYYIVVMPLVTPSITIPDWELTETFIRASGPGGQNVNKVETAVQLRFNALGSPSLSDAVKMRLKAIAGRRMNKDGEIIIEAKRFRSRERNREDARARLAALIERAATPPAPRKKTRVPFSQKRKRLDDKRRRSETKTRRSLTKLSD